jgi:arylsulfatase A-like enzyme
VVQRLGDDLAPQPIFSVPSFYGAHGYASHLESMSAIFFAAGPDIYHGVLPVVHNIDVAPTILELLGVPPAETVKGDPLPVRKPLPVIE